MIPRKRKLSLKLKSMMAVFALMVACCVFVFMLPYLDTVGVEGIQCDVMSAEPSQSSGGRGGTLPFVLIKTENCGDFGWGSGVTFDNRTEMASSFPPGRYVFQVGWTSRVFIPLLPNGLPTLRGYNRLG